MSKQQGRPDKPRKAPVRPSSPAEGADRPDRAIILFEGTGGLHSTADVRQPARRQVLARA